MLPIADNRGANILKIEGIGISSVISELEGKFGNLSYSILYHSGGTLLLSIIMSEPFILENLVKIGIPMQYPVIISSGIASVSLVTERNKIDKFLSELEKISIDFSIKEIGFYRKKPVLTETQRKILFKAYKEGYFEIPRIKSMKNLAEEMNPKISTSSMSETLRRTFKRLAEGVFPEITMI